jgi:hypothetical protein
MGTRNFFVAVAVAATAVGAQANSSFVFDVRGSGLSAVGGTEGCSPDHPDQCVHAIDWVGTFTVQTTSSADGTYDVGYLAGDDWVPGGIVRVTLDSNAGSVDVDAQEVPGTEFFPGPYPYAVTILDQRVTSIEWTSMERPDGVGFLQIDGFAAHFQTSSYHGPYADVTGTLTAVVPEPGGIALSLLGLAATALGTRRARGQRAPCASPVLR